MTRFILYKNGRKYSNIKFSSIEEVLNYMDFSLNSYWLYTDFYDIFDANTGTFIERYMIEESNSGLIFVKKTPAKAPKNRRFK